jgi:hypothetical protein
MGDLNKMAENMYLLDYLAFRIINMGLLISAMVGLSRTSFDSSGNCNDTSYQLL